MTIRLPGLRTQSKAPPNLFQEVSPYVISFERLGEQCTVKEDLPFVREGSDFESVVQEGYNRSKRISAFQNHSHVISFMNRLPEEYRYPQSRLHS